jgi:hypothetical protein
VRAIVFAAKSTADPKGSIKTRLEAEELAGFDAARAAAERKLSEAKRELTKWQGRAKRSREPFYAKATRAREDAFDHAVAQVEQWEEAVAAAEAAITAVPTEVDHDFMLDTFNRQREVLLKHTAGVNDRLR